jgi:hypothetical protein
MGLASDQQADDTASFSDESTVHGSSHKSTSHPKFDPFHPRIYHVQTQTFILIIVHALGFHSRAYALLRPFDDHEGIISSLTSCQDVEFNLSDLIWFSVMRHFCQCLTDIYSTLS